MKRISRRHFAKIAAATAAAAPVGALLAAPQAPAQTPAAPPEPRVKLTPEQEPRVRQAVDRRDRQLGNFRSRALPYELEPAFVFKVKSKR
jgi:hypothetical protein